MYPRLTIRIRHYLWGILVVALWGCQASDSLQPSPLRLLGTQYQEEGIDLLPLDNGHMLLLGHTNAANAKGQQDVLFAELDADLSLTWSTLWGDVGLDKGGRLAQDRTGGTWGFATLDPTNSEDQMRLVRVIREARTLATLDWVPTDINGATAVDMLQAEDGDLVVLGNGLNDGLQPARILLYKIAPGGEQRWPTGRQFTQNNQTLVAQRVLEVPGGQGFVILGTTDLDLEDLGGPNLILIRTDRNGIPIKQQVIGRRSTDVAVDLVVNQEELIVLGYWQSSQGVANPYVFKTNWELDDPDLRPYNQPGFTPTSLVALSDGSFMLGGSYQASPTDTRDMALLKLPPTLFPADSLIRLGFEQDETLVKMMVAPHSQPEELILMGNIDFLNGNQMIGLLKINTDGVIQP